MVNGKMQQQQQLQPRKKKGKNVALALHHEDRKIVANGKEFLCE
jgi:hypothetical protein